VTEQGQVLTAAEAAKLLGLSHSAVCKMAQDEEIPAWRVGRQWKFYKEALLPFIKEEASENGERVIVRHKKSTGTHICPAGTVPGLKAVLEDLDMTPEEFAFISGLEFEFVRKTIEGMWISAKDRERILETVVALRRQKRENEAMEVREVMG